MLTLVHGVGATWFEYGNSPADACETIATAFHMMKVNTQSLVLFGGSTTLNKILYMNPASSGCHNHQVAYFAEIDQQLSTVNLLYERVLGDVVMLNGKAHYLNTLCGIRYQTTSTTAFTDFIVCAPLQLFGATNAFN